MGKSVEFYFDVGSPASYLAWTQLPALCEAAGAALVYKPMLLGGVFQATGNASPATIPAKGAYTVRDFKAMLKATTAEAVARGVFGAPTTFVGNEMFFGQDRLDMIRDELAR